MIGTCHVQVVYFKHIKCMIVIKLKDLMLSLRITKQVFQHNIHTPKNIHSGWTKRQVFIYCRVKIYFLDLNNLYSWYFLGLTSKFLQIITQRILIILLKYAILVYAQDRYLSCSRNSLGLVFIYRKEITAENCVLIEN